MHERTGTRPGISRLCLSALALAGAIFLNTALCIGLLTNTSDKPATIAEAPPAPAVRVVVRAQMQSAKPESATTRPGPTTCEIHEREG